MTQLDYQIAFVAPIDNNDAEAAKPSSRAPAENIIQPSGLAPQFDQNGNMVAKNTAINATPFYETPLFIGGALFLILIVIFIGALIIKRKYNK